jgi:hypothetical protein
MKHCPAHFKPDKMGQVELRSGHHKEKKRINISGKLSFRKERKSPQKEIQAAKNSDESDFDTDAYLAWRNTNCESKLSIEDVGSNDETDSSRDDEFDEPGNKGSQNKHTADEDQWSLDAIDTTPVFKMAHQAKHMGDYDSCHSKGSNGRERSVINEDSEIRIGNRNHDGIRDLRATNY